jgi:hypothetical protein
MLDLVSGAESLIKNSLLVNKKVDIAGRIKF